MDGLLSITTQPALAQSSRACSTWLHKPRDGEHLRSRWNKQQEKRRRKDTEEPPQHTRVGAKQRGRQQAGAVTTWRLRQAPAGGSDPRPMARRQTAARCHLAAPWAHCARPHPAQPASPHGCHTNKRSHCCCFSSSRRGAVGFMQPYGVSGTRKNSKRGHRLTHSQASSAIACSLTGPQSEGKGLKQEVKVLMKGNALPHHC